MSTTIRVGTYNLEEGGVDDGDDARLRRQLDMLAGLHLHALALQECKNFDANGWRRLRQVERALGMHAYPVRSAHHGCHLAWLIAEPLQLIEERHDQAPPWWHAFCGLLVEIGGQKVHLGNVHFAPSSPLQRRAESEACSLHPQHGRPAILAGDMNAFAINDPPLSHPNVPLKERKKHDQSPAIELEEAGLRDIGAFFEDLTPTVGHHSGLAYRCDRIHSNLPDEALLDYCVIQEDQPNSNHRPVVAELEIDACPS